jgi:hypothetical protein
MAHTLEEYEAQKGWSSELFADHAGQLMRELIDLGVRVTIHRTVIHLRGKTGSIKAYVHHNGRSPEWATLTNWRGEELGSFHHTDFDQLAASVKCAILESKYWVTV